MNNPIFARGKIYHIYNKGVDGRNIFLNERDYFRFIHNLFEFNDINPAANIYYKNFNSSNSQSYELRLRKFQNKQKMQPRKLLVKILAFCLMPNHFHLLIEQIKENGITDFMRKLGTGYTNYFNVAHKRHGVLFQGKFKAILVEEQSHFIHLPYYLHLNPLDLSIPGWRKREINNYKKAIKFLKSYRWSSYLDYVGIKNFPSVTQRDFLLNFYNGQENYKKELIDWLKSLNTDTLNDLKDYTLE